MGGWLLLRDPACRRCCCAAAEMPTGGCAEVAAKGCWRFQAAEVCGAAGCARNTLLGCEVALLDRVNCKPCLCEDASRSP